MRKIRCFLLAFAALLMPMASFAQFYNNGTDAARVKWSSITTDDYRIIYPRGCDSLARVYAVALERAKGPVSGSIGYSPNHFYKKPLPVVLHTQTASSNGMVTWTPRRMELYTVPEAYSPEPMPWEQMLAIHESRHASQMQLGREDCFRWANILFGEITPGALSAIYGGPDFLEGDAVVTETALSNSGRGRTADFLEYMRASFLEGQTRNYWQWRYGSLTRFTPDYYKIGYLTNAGIRTMFDEPDFTRRFYSRAAEHNGWAFGNMKRIVEEVSGMRFADAWAAVADSLTAIWQDEAALREPYTQAQQLTEPGKYYTEFTSPFVLDGQLYALRSGITRNSQIVRIDQDGKVSTVKNFSSVASPVKVSSEGLAYWSEHRSDVRWEMRATSIICCWDGKVVRHIMKGGRYYNPTPSPDGSRLAVASYPEEGGTELTIADALDGTVISSTPLPAGWQLLETAWTQDGLFLSVLTEDGMGILDAGNMAPVLEPLPVKIKQLSSCGRLLTFVCDKGGSNEVYALDPSDGALRRLTSSFVGASDYCFDGGKMYYAQPSAAGRSLFVADASEGAPAEWDDSYRYPMADELSAGDAGNEAPVLAEKDITISEPENYGKFRHLIHFHSWVPLFVDADAVSTASAESIASSAGLGATAFFQNALGSADGYMGVNFTDAAFDWDPTFNFKFRYLGWYPVLEANISAHTRYATELHATYKQEDNTMSFVNTPYGVPLMSANLKAYVPVATSTGGVTRGIIPQVSVGLSTNKLSEIVYEMKKETSTISIHGFLPIHRMTASLRGYVIGNTPESCVYPKFGVGLEGGYVGRPFMQQLYCSDMYVSMYGYVPGLGQTHGLRLAAKAQFRMDDGMLCEPAIEMRPRGFTGESLLYRVASYPVSAMVSADYVLPFARLDWKGLGGIGYVRNFELRPFADYLYCAQRGNYEEAGLFSVGAVFNVVLGNLCWLPYTTRIGVSFSWNGGSGWSVFQEDKVELNRTDIGINFTVDL